MRMCGEETLRRRNVGSEGVSASLFDSTLGNPTAHAAVMVFATRAKR